MPPFRSTCRTIIAGLVAASIATPAFASCIQPSEKPGFEIRALQSQLMVVALTCSREDDFNRFVLQNRGVLVGAYNDVQRHFRRVSGGAWQRQIDAYITNAANSHSQVGISQGSLFCSNQAQLFPAALAVNTREQLAQLSQQRQIVQVYDLPICPAGGAPRATGPRATQPAARPAQPQANRPPQPQANRPAAQGTSTASAPRS